MSLLESVEAATGLGTIKVMQSTSGNHSAMDWATTTAEDIFNPIVDEVNEIDVKNVRTMITNALEPIFGHAMVNEKVNLSEDDSHCAKQIEAQYWAKLALVEIYKLPEHIWTTKVTKSDWYHAAMVHIGTMIATAKHIERLLFADVNLNNVAAQNYKQGVR